MKLIIQIPCYNEAESISLTLSHIPKNIPGFEKVEILIIDDGSSDNTATIAMKTGANHLFRLTHHQGLAKAFTEGIAESLRLGADVIVNTDADNQYNALDIEKLVSPILAGCADIVIGSRPINDIEHFSPLKKFLQKFGTQVVCLFSESSVKDATSGFRAISKKTAMQLNIFNGYTYTLEMLLQAKQKNLFVMDVPIRVNEYQRPSRLVKSTFSYVLRSIYTIGRAFIIYKPFPFFFTIGTLIFSLGLIIGLRYLWLIFIGEGKGHVQSVILSSGFLIIGFQVILVAFLSNLLAVNRKILEDIQYQMRQERYKKSSL
ncbi:MAG TPA: glycosyltransferase family 2 protein [Candidatus Omnitrophota bacterium]|nr:glycosyltransferase family 2 protein [Candidatus Omnitrophota bacterium]